jgi:transcriptional regulator GlxA family with amidase domain
MTAASALIRARPLAAQAHALRAAAIFIEHAATAGLVLTVDAGAFITVCVPDQPGDPAARAALVTALAAAADEGDTVRSIALGCQARYRITGYGQLAGHPVTITTTGAKTR